MTESEKKTWNSRLSESQGQDLYLDQMRENKNFIGLVKSLTSETDDGCSSCSKFPERTT